ncbi:unnamed protein product [Agarophyton chilense]
MSPPSSTSFRRAQITRHVRPTSCLPSNKNEDKSDTQQQQTQGPETTASQWKLSQTNKKIIAEAEATFTELDAMAEQWIGADLSRWEWYERLKSRRQKMMVESKKTDKDMDDSYERLRDTFMEFDALFGTKFLDNETRISPVGWTIVGLIMGLYVFIGYAAVELIVKLITETSTNHWL